jgi:hypothetical protein
MPAKRGSENWGRKAADAATDAIIHIQDGRERGRPVIHDPAQYQAEIVSRLMTGESLVMICRDPDMPSLRTVNRWQADDAQFKQAVQQGKALGTETLMDAAYTIAAGGPLSTGSVERDKLLISVIRWIAEKRDPQNHRAMQLINIVVRDDSDDIC